ncbi:transposase (plasmid) [Cupriavidus necator]|nr:transposase [Cupriavidus necator]
MKAKSAGWGHEELEGLDFGDARRNERAKTLVTRFAANPTASIPVACNGRAETMGAYRFLEKEEIDWRGILEAHWQRTEERMREHEVVLCLQDTTELDFRGQTIEGLGELNYEARRGMYLHVRRESRLIRCFTADIGGRKPGVPSPVVYRCMQRR